MFDENKILGQKESDGSFGGGDSLSWCGSLALLGGTELNIYDTFSKGFGGLARHPSEGYSAYYKHPWDGRISRDQLTGAIAGMIAQKDRKGLLKVFLHHLAWLNLFAYNTRHNGELSKWKLPDFTGPDIWAMYIRGLLGKWSYLLYPVLCLFDLMLVGNAFVNKKNNDGHVISSLAKLIVALETTPSFVAIYAARINSREFYEWNLKGYWCGWRQNCFMLDLYKSKFDSLARYFK